MSEFEDETQEPTGPTEPGDEEQEEAEQTEQTEQAEGDEQPDAEAPENVAEEVAAEEQPQGLSEKEIEKINKQLDKLRETTANRVGAILGDDATALEPCPVCGESIPGHIFPANVAPPDEATVDAVKHYIGIPTSGEFKPHPNFQKCDECDGMSEVLTGSQRPGMWTERCPGCNGLGYKSTATQRVLTETNGTTTPTPIVTGPMMTDQPLPPEAQRLKELGYLVVAPVPSAQVAE